MKRAADLAEAVYSMPGNRNGLPQSRSPPMNHSSMANYNGYSSQLAVSVHEPVSNGQWKEGKLNHLGYCRQWTEQRFLFIFDFPFSWKILLI